MQRVLTSEQSLAAEMRAVADAGASITGLMEAAGAAVAVRVQERVPAGDVVVIAGTGNNGGDGWVAARLLVSAGRIARVLTLRHPDQLEGPAAAAAQSALRAGVKWEVLGAKDAARGVHGASAVVDAILGTGSRLPLSDSLEGWCAAINASDAFVLSVDVPTGVDPDSGACSPSAVRADCTVTFTAPKLGLVMFPGAACTGELVVADLGIPPVFVDTPGAPELWTAEEFGALVPLPAPDAHKSQRGRVLIVAGSGYYPGAAVLAARGAMRAGAGYVTLAVPEPVVRIAQAHLLAVPVVGLPSFGRTFSSSAAGAVRDLAVDYDAVVLGPGITVADGAAATARMVVSNVDRPLVLDADGLNAFVDHVGSIESRVAPTVLTPHPGELGRLLGMSTDAIQANRFSASARLSGSARAVVLKGAGTVTSCGGRQVVNTSGSPALATAGTGDVLAGVVGALLAQGLGPLDAGALAAYVHGRAGELAQADLTVVSVTAEDLPDYLSLAFAELLGMQRGRTPARLFERSR